MSYEWTFDKHADKITRKKAPFWRSFARTPANVTTPVEYFELLICGTNPH